MSFKDYLVTKYGYSEWMPPQMFIDLESAWKAAQEDMRERAAFVCQEKSELRIYAEYENILEQSANEIRILPIEV